MVHTRRTPHLSCNVGCTPIAHGHKPRQQATEQQSNKRVSKISRTHRSFLLALPPELIEAILSFVSSDEIGEVLTGRRLCAVRSSSRQLNTHANSFWQELLLPLKSPPNLLQVHVGGHHGCLKNLRHFESLASPTYMISQSDINEKMRAILIDWLVEVHRVFKLVPETLYMTVSLLDRFLAKRDVVRGKLQLIGVTSMWLASKSVEIYPPEVRDFVYICDKVYSREEIISQEAQVLDALGWEMDKPHAHTFLTHLLQASAKPLKLTHLAQYLLELSLQKYHMLRFLPPTLAASAVYLARKTMGLLAWTPELAQRTCCTVEFIMPCVRDLHALHKAAAGDMLSSVRKKYALEKSLRVSLLAPATL